MVILSYEMILLLFFCHCIRTAFARNDVWARGAILITLTFVAAFAEQTHKIYSCIMQSLKTRFNCANHFHLSRELSQPFTRRPLSRCFPASFALRVWTFAKGTIFHAAQLLMVTMKLGEPQNRQILRWNHHRRSNLGWLDLRMAKHGKTTLCSPETNQSLSCLASLAIFMYSFNHRILVMLRNPYRNIPWDLQAQTKKTLGNFQLWKTKKNSILKNGKPSN